MNILQFIIILLFIQYPCSKGFSFKKFKGKIKTLITGKGEKPDAEFILDSGPEYPGNDPEKKAQIKDMWNTYYDCLRMNFENHGPLRTVMPEARMVFEGSSVRLSCKVCISPMDTETIENVTWYYRSIPPTGTTPVELGDHVFVSPDDKALHMYNLNIQSSGQYFCQKKTTVTAPYFLEVVGDTEPTQMVRPDTAPHAMHSLKAQIIPEHNLEVFTEWGKWSSCTKCDKVGKKIRFGICTVKQLNPKSFVKVTTGTSQAVNQSTVGNSTLNKRELNDKEKRIHNVLALFRLGIPCRSFLMPETIGNLPQIAERKSEIMVRFCKETCPEPTVFRVLDEKGRVIETANNSAGIYSTLQGLPPILPAVQRKTIHEYTNSQSIVLKCPGNLNIDIPVLWQIGSQNINPAAIYYQSNGRVYINVRDQLVIKKPQITDGNIFSCWQNNELAGTIRLVVSKKMELSLNHHIMLIGMVLVLGTFLLVYYRAFRGRKRVLAR